MKKTCFRLEAHVYGVVRGQAFSVNVNFVAEADVCPSFKEVNGDCVLSLAVA